MDKIILQLLSDKNESGLKLLEETYGKLIRYIIAGILGNREGDIEECLNDTYLKIWKNASSFDFEKASLKTYIASAARNNAINKLRDVKKKESARYIDGINEVVAEYIDYKQNIEGMIIQKEEAVFIRKIVDKLNKRDRELIYRKYFYLQTSSVIADSMNMTIRAVDSRIHRIRKLLRQEYEQGNNPPNILRKGISIWMIIF